MSYKLNRPLKIKEAGIFIQSQLFWLVASPDGVIFDKKLQEIGLVESKCPYNKRNSLLKILLLTKRLILPLTKMKNHI